MVSCFHEIICLFVIIYLPSWESQIYPAFHITEFTWCGNIALSLSPPLLIFRTHLSDFYVYALQQGNGCPGMIEKIPPNHIHYMVVLVQVRQPINQSVSQLIDQLIDQSISQRVSWSINHNIVERLRDMLCAFIIFTLDLFRDMFVLQREIVWQKQNGGDAGVIMFPIAASVKWYPRL